MSTATEIMCWLVVAAFLLFLVERRQWWLKKKLSDRIAQQEDEDGKKWAKIADQEARVQQMHEDFHQKRETEKSS